jgi:hypothetical protein
MRFEAKHSYFKPLEMKMKNIISINPSFIMAMRIIIGSVGNSKLRGIGFLNFYF